MDRMDRILDWVGGGMDSGWGRRASCLWGEYGIASRCGGLGPDTGRAAGLDMTDFPRILDNERAAVADRLRRSLRAADACDCVSAYFTIYGYELLAEELESVGAVRFLFGEPNSVEQLDPGAREPKSFELTERGLAPNYTLHQRYLARRCAAWVNRDDVAIRSVRQSNFLHGKLYLTDGPDGGSGIVGSSNFTRRGLGGSDYANLEINLATDDAATLAELREWFNRLWNDQRRTEDVKQRVRDALARIGMDYAPEWVYYKTLYELFRRDIEAMQAGDDDLNAVGFTNTRIWNALYEFQKDGARSIIAKLRAHGGCILADSVGLGKTYTALAVIKYFELRNERVLVLCPRKLWENWSLYQAANGHLQNPFAGDRLGYTLLAHTDLSRKSGMAGGVDLASFNWAGYDLVVIDESHNFRNDDGQRYQRLLQEVIASGARTKVLMLSATPVNTGLVDLRNQIYLMTEGREDAFRQSLGVGSIRMVMGAAQREFREWEMGRGGGGGTAARQGRVGGRRRKSQLLDRLGADFLRLLDGVSIARSRRLVEQFYAAEMERIGQFPEHAPPVNAYPPTDLAGALSYTELADRIGEFRLAVYQPTEYVTDPDRLAELAAARRRYNFNQQDSEHYLIAMMRTNFLKRLESSAHSLALTLGRTIGKIDALLGRIERYQNDGQSEIMLTANDWPDDDEEDEEFFVNRGRRPYRLSELDLPRWAEDLRQDKATLSAALAQVKAVTPERDGKLAEIKRAIRNKVEHPVVDRDGKPNRKLLVFTTFKDTARYLYDELGGLAGEWGINIAMVSGDETFTSRGVNNFNEILANFAPVARNRRAGDEVDESDAAGADIDLLIATDCISEGQNLQDCDTVVNYDIHWNPVRIIQRFGRIDRIGSRSAAVQLVNYWPTPDMEHYLRLQSRVQARMALADLAASGDGDPLDEARFTEADAESEISFRNEQLLRLRREALTLEELDDAPTLGDFTLDHFVAQLLRYLERNRDALEAMPPGAYAVAESDAAAGGGADGGGANGSDAAVEPGVIFCLRQRNAGAEADAETGVASGVASSAESGVRNAGRDDGARRPAASPRHPFYLVYILPGGVIRFGCASLPQTLAVFEAAADGQTAPIRELCDAFDRETEQGRKMAFYDGLLSASVAQIVQAYAGVQLGGLGMGGDRGFTLAPADETPRTASDFELVTWLVIKERRG